LVADGHSEVAEEKPLDDGEDVNIGISVAIRRNSLGIRIRLQDENPHWSVMADVALEYNWDGPVDYDVDEVRHFMSGEGIPRSLASAAAIYCDAAMSIGVKVTNHSFAAQGAVIDHFNSSFSSEDLFNIAEKS